MVSSGADATDKVSEERLNYNFLHGKLLSSHLPGDEIVISGAAGAFPNSRNIEEFKNNLLNKIPMVSPNRRWGNVHAEIPKCSGSLPEIDKFDAGFFGIHEKQGHAQDTMSRLILEKTIEAVFDAGLHPSDLAKGRTGVFLGVCFSETEKNTFFDNASPQEYGITGCSRNIIAHRISYYLNLKGPSMIVDTACSSSMYAVEHAFRSIRLGEIDAAIVGGVNLCLHPFVSLQFARLGVLSIDGCCKVFDDAADGYARSESVGVLILQRAKDAKRNYAEIIHAKSNCDGYKEYGITFPSKYAQRLLLKEFYEECGIDPLTLSYLEAHGTGTSVGDPAETAAIDDILAKGRKTSLLIGSVKSNIGHSEPTSGLASIVKCILGFETGIIPPNCHFRTPSKSIPGLLEGRMRVVTEPMAFEDERGLIGVNSFGFGGGNCHILLSKNKKEKINSGLPSDNLPRIVCVSGRTEESVITLLEDVKAFPDVDRIRLLHNVFRKPVRNHLFRGFSIVSKYGESYRFLERFHGKCMALFLAFGELNDWHDIGNQLMALPAFSVFIQRIHEKISIHGVNIKDTFQNSSSYRRTYHILGSVVVQVGLINLFKLLKIKPKYCYGYSFGGLLAAYANGIITLEDVLNCSLIINDSINETCDFYKISNEGTQMNTAEVPLLDRLKEDLKSEKSTARKLVLQNLTNSIRSNKISNQLTKQTLEFVDCFVNSLSENVSGNFEHFAKNSIFLTVGKFHPVEDMENFEDVKVNPLFQLGSEGHLQGLLKVLGDLYVNGHCPQLANLYPEVQFPVSKGTRMISPYIQWKHDTRIWFIPFYDTFAKHVALQGTRTIKIQLTDQEWSYVSGHVIDGRNLFPATGYLFLAWETLTIIDDRPLSVRHVAFENCKFIRATSVPKKGLLILKIVLNSISGNFEVIEGDSTVMSGRVYVTQKGVDNPSPSGCLDSSHLTMKTWDIYKDLTLRGYNYKGSFRNIVSCNTDASEGRIRWDGNWVTFLDNMLQMKILGTDSRLLYVPTFIEYILIPGKEHARWTLEEYTDKGLEPILPVYIDKSNGEIRCGNALIKGLIASSIPLKRDFGIPVLEKYLFVPNITSLQLHESIRVNMQILLENALMYKVKVIELIDEYTKDQNECLTTIIKIALEDQPLIQLLPKILSKESLDMAIPVENTKMSEEKDCSLIIVSRLFERSEVLRTALSSLKDNGFILSRESPDFSISHTSQLDVSICTVHNIQSETHVLLKKNCKPRNSVALKINSSDDFTWIDKTKELIKNKSSDNVILYSDNRDNSGILGLVNCLRREPESNFIRCLFVMDKVEDINVEEPIYQKQLQKHMAINVFKNGVWGTYRHLLVNDLNRVENEHCFANQKVKGDLSSLQWFEGPLRNDMDIPPEKKLIYIYYAALNFRDVMTASGKINADIVTNERTQQECVQGFEFAGVDSEGNRVMGMVTHGALGSLILADNYVTFRMPEELSMEEAATIPVVYATAIYGFIMRARLRRGESVLIHSGTGGVGQAAIRLALFFGCEIFTTVGTQEKRDYLKKIFPSLKDHHIGNSRDISFETMVMRGTKGRGVDVVLNSLADEKLQASIRCLAKGGRFVEIGKFDLGKNTQCNLMLLEREGSFHGVMVDHLICLTPAVKYVISRLIKEGIDAGYVKPLDRVIFKKDQLEEAFRFMASGKHMGKVLVQIREPEELQKAVPSVLKFPCTARYSCEPTYLYVICGGLGGFGLELADWLVLRGARKLVLTTRKGVSTGYQEYRIRIWKSYGVIVHISKAKITTEKGCTSLIEDAQKLGPVKAIFNLAVVLADAVFENQTQESFSASFGPKASATKYLDQISRELCPNLSDFVVFSSVSCGRGNAGQTNYGMANSIMERICEERVKAGYPGLAIQWGAVGQVGLVAEMQEVDQELEIGGTLQQKISNCLNVLDSFLKQKNHTIVSSMVVAEKRGGLEHADNIVDAVVNILGVTDAKCVSHHTTLAELGMDSMTAVEIKQTLEREFEVFLSAKDMRTMTLAKLKKIQEDRSKDTGDNTEQPSTNVGVEMLFRIYQSEKEFQLPYLRFEPKQLENTSKVILFPGIDGFGRVFETLASELECEAFAMQYRYNDNSDSISDMANLLIPTLEELISPDEPFTMVSYSFGAVVALEVVSILESKNYCGSLILIDGSPEVCAQTFKELNLDSEVLYEMYILNHLMSFFLPPTVITQHQDDLSKCKSWEDRVDMVTDLVGDRSSYKKATQKLIASGIYERMKAIKSYTVPYNKLKSKMILFKPTEMMVNAAEGDYGLSKISEQPVDVQVFEGNHLTILDNLKIATSLNSFMSSKNRVASG